MLGVGVGVDVGVGAGAARAWAWVFSVSDCVSSPSRSLFQWKQIFQDFSIAIIKSLETGLLLKCCLVKLVSAFL